MAASLTTKRRNEQQFRDALGIVKTMRPYHAILPAIGTDKEARRSLRESGSFHCVIRSIADLKICADHADGPAGLCKGLASTSHQSDYYPLRGARVRR